MKNMSGALAAPGDLDAASWVEIQSHRDERGTLTVIEGGIDIPFEIKRVYFVHDVEQDRGGHAHRKTHQVITALSGRAELVLSTATRSRTFILEDVKKGVYICPMLFIEMKRFAPDTRIAVFANTHYDKSLSIRSWSDYLKEGEICAS